MPTEVNTDAIPASAVAASRAGPSLPLSPRAPEERLRNRGRLPVHCSPADSRVNGSRALRLPEGYTMPASCYPSGQTPTFSE